ncbi:MAG TPA: FG-GAP-like repeat-containing protein [Anaeromyxobacter sp.]|nr:FG-GAP-like repeat-containing protein [Anaeromyxobacter sp.]
MNAFLLALALGAGALSNFPREAGARIAHPAVLVSISGAPVVVVAAADRLTAFRADGGTPSGLPVPLSAAQDEVASGAPAAADMDGDGRPEIAVATSSGRVFLWSGGGVVPGFPIRLGTPVRAGVSFGDVDGDGRPELLVGDDAGRLHAFKKNGTEVKGFPIRLGAPVTSAATTAVLPGGRVVAVGCEDGKVHVLDTRTLRERNGFPVVTHYAVSGAPVFADLDDDGVLDLVVASQDFQVYAVTAQGESLPGFPVAAGYRIYEGPAIADLDGDGKLDVIFASADGMIHAVNRAGVPLRGFPVRVGGRMVGGPAVGDVDRDGRLEVVVVSGDGAVHALSREGKELPGFPADLGVPDVTASPLLADLAGDGTLSIFVGLPSGDLQALRAERGGSALAAAPWPGPGHDAAHSGRFGPYPPTYKDLRLDPGSPTVVDGLRAGWRAVWLDAPAGESPPAPHITWYRNGAAVRELDNKRELPPGTARRGERWRFALVAPAAAGRAEGPAVQGPEVLVRDTAPGAPEVAIEPPRPLRLVPSKAIVTRPALDPDGDAVTYSYEWLVDGVPIGVTGDSLPGEKLRKGALVGVRVVASDGELQGPAALALARVADTPPGPVEIAIEQDKPHRSEPIRVKITKPATDVDEDPVSYEYRWVVTGTVQNLPAASAELPTGLFAKHQKVRVEAWGTDGELPGPSASAEVTVLNSPPTAPTVVIQPEAPRKGQALRAVIAAAAQDADNDPLTYRFSWKKNGQPFAGAVAEGREIPGSAVARGDRFEVLVVANDGEVDGPPAAAVVEAVNTPPLPPTVAIEPRHPRGGEPLRLVVLEPSKDADGDKVTDTIAWTRNGQPTGSGEAILPATAFHKHEKVRVTVTPRDPFESGASSSDEVVVEDAAPGAPAIAFTAEKPTVGAPLEAKVVTPAPDADGDPLVYRYRWTRDGVPVAVSDGSDTSLRAPYWTASAKVPMAELAKGQHWEVEAQAYDGEEYGPPVRAQVAVVNTPPPAPAIKFVPQRPRRVDGLAISGQQPPDADGDLITYRYTWTRNGQKFDAPPEQAFIARGVPRKGEHWAVEVTSNDGEADGPPVRIETVIADTAPGPTAVSLCDGPVPSGSVVDARIARPSVDADGDTVVYRYEWFLNGAPVPAAKGQTRFTAQALKKHDLLRVAVTPFDGELSGPVASAECQVVNTPPGAPVVALEPAEPTALSGVRAVVTKPSPDRDGDQVSYRYAWTRDGLPVPLEGAAIPPHTIRHGEAWRVEVTPFDGEEKGEPAVAQATVRNTPPETPVVMVIPEVAGVGQELTCQVKAAPRDADEELVTVHYQWYRNGQLVPVAEGSSTLPAGIVRRGDRWRCDVWASDGFADSPHVAGEITIRNTPPTAPLVVVEPERPHRRDTLACRIASPSLDRDGDPVTYSYAWWRNGKPAAAGPDPARVEPSRIAKNERWRCAATPSDGLSTGPPGTAERVVLNSPPGPARVRLSPATPRPGQPLRCEIVAPSEDDDRDAVRYRFTWVRNGVPQPFAGSSQDVPGRLVKAGDRWRCRVVPSDGTDEGPETASEEATVPEGAETTTLSATP